MYLISDNIDSYTGMRLAGVEGAVVHEKQELKAEIDKVLADKEIGILLLTEKFGRDFPDVVNNVKLNCKVKNTGKVAGDEVVQLYLHDEMSSVTTYVKVLRGFERIHLEPGEEKVIDFVLTPQEMGLWNKDNHFVVEPGTFAVMVGSSSQDIRLQGKFEVK